MTVNIGKLDRALRLFLGTVLLAMMFFDPSNYFWLIGFIPLATGSMQFCPLYRFLGVSTAPPKKKIV